MNWGTKIILGMVAFMLFIVGMVTYMFKVHGNDALIATDYYEKGINYNEEYQAQQNTVANNATPLITINASQIIIQLKDSASYSLKLMNPAIAKEDLIIKGNTIGDSNLILIDRTKLRNGLWFLELNWTSTNKPYLFKKNLTL